MPRLSLHSPTRRHLYATIVVVWCVGVLAVYYQRLWRLLGGDLSVWQDLVSEGILSPSFGAVALVGLAGFLIFSRISAGKLHWSWRRPVDGGRLLVFAVSVVLLGVICFLGRLPFATEALWRNVQAIGGASSVVLAASFHGRLIRDLMGWSFVSVRDDFIYQMVLGLGTISLLSMGAAWVGVYTKAGVQVFIVVSAGLGLAWSALGWHRLRKRDRCNVNVARRFHARGGDAVWKTVVLVSGVIGVVGALAPETEYDALWYHLWLPKLWLQQGGTVDVVREYVSLYPLNYELLFGAGLAVGGPVAAKVLHYMALIFNGLVVVSLVRSFLPRVSPWLAAALFVSTPTVLWEATTAYVDLGLAFFLSAAAYAVFRFVGTRSSQWYFLASISLGLALGTKHLALFALGIMTVALILCLWKESSPTFSISFQVAGIVAIALVLAGAWYVRAYIASGNPFFPDLYSVFGAEPPERWSILSEGKLQRFKDHFGGSRSLIDILFLPYNVMMHGERYGASFGVPLLLLIPGLLLTRPCSPVLGWLVFSLGAYLALWATPISSFQGRFLIPLLPFLSVLAAAGFSGVARSLFPRWKPWVRTGCSALVALLCVLNLPPFTSLHERNRVGDRNWLTHVVRHIPLPVVLGAEQEAAYVRRSVRSYAAWQFINRTLPDSARILTFTGGDHFYSERWRVWSEAPLVHGAVWGAEEGDERSALEILRGLAVTHILVDKTRIRKGELGGLPLLQPPVVESHYQAEFEDDNAILYRILW